MTSSDGPSQEPCAVTVTRLLNEAAGTAGNEAASSAAALLPMIYDELRRLARSRMRQQPPEHTLQATALVHEAYLRLVKGGSVRQWAGRRHFFAAAAEAMRCILVDNARRRGRLKRGGARQRVHPDVADLTADEPPEDLLALDEALAELAQKHPEKAELVNLRYFAGLTMDQTAQTLGISTATAERRWAFCRAWLYRRINGRSD